MDEGRIGLAPPLPLRFLLSILYLISMGTRLGPTGFACSFTSWVANQWPDMQHSPSRSVGPVRRMDQGENPTLARLGLPGCGGTVPGLRLWVRPPPSARWPCLFVTRDTPPPPTQRCRGQRWGAGPGGHHSVRVRRRLDPGRCAWPGPWFRKRACYGRGEATDGLSGWKRRPSQK